MLDIQKVERELDFDTSAGIQEMAMAVDNTQVEGEHWEHGFI